MLSIILKYYIHLHINKTKNQVFWCKNLNIYFTVKSKAFTKKFLVNNCLNWKRTFYNFDMRMFLNFIYIYLKSRLYYICSHKPKVPEFCFSIIILVWPLQYSYCMFYWDLMNQWCNKETILVQKAGSLIYWNISHNMWLYTVRSRFKMSSTFFQFVIFYVWFARNVVIDLWRGRWKCCLIERLIHLTLTQLNCSGRKSYINSLSERNINYI